MSRMTPMQCAGSMIAMLMLVAIGCNDGSNSRPAPPSNPAPDNAVSDPSMIPQDPTAVPSETASGAVTVREKADVGVGEKGHDYPTGPISTPIQTLFRSQERIVFDIEIPHAMQIYKAEHDHAPQTEKEFMEEIVRANQIKLPQLPPGRRYVYDPAAERLMVEHTVEGTQ